MCQSYLLKHNLGHFYLSNTPLAQSKRALAAIYSIVSHGASTLPRSNLNSNFASVNEQSGFRAGDAGFAVNVTGNTALVGGVITSTQTAVDNNANSFRTGGALSITDVQNTASFTGQGGSIGISVGIGKDKDKNSTLSPGGSAGFGTVKGDAASTSSGGISGIAGNTAVRTGDANTGLTRIFDPVREQRELDARVAITAAITKEAPKAVATFSDNQIKALEKELQKELENEKDPAKIASLNADIKSWREGGGSRVALQTVVGLLTGGVGGGLGALASSSAAPLMNEFQDRLVSGLRDAGLPDIVAQGFGSVISSLAIASVGGVLGGTAGAATAFGTDVNNRQLHPAEQTLARQLAQRAKASGVNLTEADIAAALRQAGIKGSVIGPDQVAQITNPGNTDPTVPGARFDSQMPLIRGSGPGPLVEDAVPASPEAIAYVRQITGGVNSPYYWSASAIAPATSSNVPPAETNVTARCANLDTACRSGVGVQQSVPISPEQQQATGEYFGNMSSQYQRMAALATVTGNAPVVLSFEIASGVTGLLEQAFRPSTGKVLVDSTIDAAALAYSRATGIPIAVINEVVERIIKPAADPLKDKIDRTVVGPK